MLKIAAFAALVLFIAATIVSASQRSRNNNNDNAVPKLHRHHRNVRSAVTDNRLIQLQRCNGTGCTNCETIMEFQPKVCHNNARFFDHGEIYRCVEAPKKKECFTETAFRDRFHQSTCNPTDLFQQAPREFDVCRQDEFGDPLKFFKYRKDGNTVTMYRGCDYSCSSCDIIQPIQINACTKVEIPLLHDFTFTISNVTSCEPGIIADHFLFPTCDGEPNFVDEVYTDQCYFFAGRQHRFQCK